MPFPDHSFEVVSCHLGLQLFPDRPAALAEMARVLVPGGRMAAMVWQSIDRSPGFAVLAEALVRFGSARELLAAYGAGSPLAGPIGDAGPAARAGLLAEVHAALGPWQSPAGLAFPIEALLVNGHQEA
jgi:SAM-dependent methyltransferase